MVTDINPALWKVILDFGAWGVSLTTLGWLFLHIRDFMALEKRVTSLEGTVAKQEAARQDQRVTNSDLMTKLEMVDDHQGELKDEVRTLARITNELQVKIARAVGGQ